MQSRGQLHRDDEPAFFHEHWRLPRSFVTHFIADADRLPGLVGERGEGFGCPVGVAGGGGDFGVAHDGFAGVFGCAGLGEVGAEEVACGSHGDWWESGVLECALPAASFDVAGEWLAVAGEDEVVGCALVFVGEFEESEPCSGVEGMNRMPCLVLGGMSQKLPVMWRAWSHPGMVTSGLSCWSCQRTSMPWMPSRVTSSLGVMAKRSAWRMPVAKARSNIRAHMSWLGVVRCVDGGCGLAGLEDDGVGGLVSWRYGGERWVDGDEFVSDGVGEDLFGADVDVVDGLA